jgi:APA family basic amino acid/polyamine antiporter
LSFLPLAVVAVVFAMISGYIAYRGVSGSTMAAIVVNVIQITTLVIISILFIIWRVKYPHPAISGGFSPYEHPNAIHIIIPHSFINLLYQSTIAILLLVGFESVTALGAEAIRPEKDIQRGVLLSLIIQGGLCYLFEYFAANFAIGNATIPPALDASGKIATAGGYTAAGTSSAPIANMLKTVGDKMLSNTGTTIGLIVAFTVMLALIGTTLACLNTGVRVTYSMAKDKEMPGVLSLLHGKYATPHGGIWVLTAVSAVLGVYGVKSVNALTQITLASNTGTFIVYGMTCIVALVAFASRADRHFVKHKAIPAIGALMNIAELLGVIYIAVKAGGDSSKNAYIALGAVVVWIILGFIWVGANPNKHHARQVLVDRKGPGVAEPPPEVPAAEVIA